MSELRKMEREGGTKSELIQGQINKEEKSRAAFIMISNLNWLLRDGTKLGTKV